MIAFRILRIYCVVRLSFIALFSALNHRVL